MTKIVTSSNYVGTSYDADLRSTHYNLPLPHRDDPAALEGVDRIGLALLMLSERLKTTADSAIAPADVDAKVSAAINGLINGAPGALDTLKELADALASNSSAIDAFAAPLADRYTKAQVDAALNAVKAERYTKAESDAKISEAISPLSFPVVSVDERKDADKWGSRQFSPAAILDMINIHAPAAAGGALPGFVASYEVPNDAYSGKRVSGSWQVEELNTIEHNSMGANLSANEITLPENGLYYAQAYVNFMNSHHSSVAYALNGTPFVRGANHFDNTSASDQSTAPAWAVFSANAGDKLTLLYWLYAISSSSQSYGYKTPDYMNYGLPSRPVVVSIWKG